MTYQQTISIFLYVIFIIYVFSIAKNEDVSREVNSNHSPNMETVLTLSSKINNCTLPQHPKNGHWFIVGPLKQSTPGQNVFSGTIINVRCNGQYMLDGPSLIECENGTWKSTIGQCLELCPPVSPMPSTTVECIKNNKAENCLKSTNGTIATFVCAPFYESVELNRNPFRVCVNGQWNQEIPFCTPICGQPKSSSKSGQIYYPWNAAIYKKYSETFKYACAGTLINERTILTAANCFTGYRDGNQAPINIFTSAVGVSSADTFDEDSQSSEIEQIFIPEQFQGNLHNDIAVVITKKKFKLTTRVQPACIDWTNKYAQVFENSTMNLSIAGPLIRRDYHFFQKVTKVPINLANKTLCYKVLAPEAADFPSQYDPFEKYCAKYEYTGCNRNDYINFNRLLPKVPMCIVDKGVGLIARNEYDDKYYVIGVLSDIIARIRFLGPCDSIFTLFTKVSNYISTFITEKVNMYTPINRKYFQTSCGIKSVKAQTFIVNGRNVTKGDYPWQVALYVIQGTIKTFICGGSLLNQRVILTAAHCVTNENDGSIFPKESYAVAAGKYYRKFDDPKDTDAQFSSLKEIFVPPQFKGQLQNFEGDIAILITETSFILTKQVHPICVDWDAKYESQFLKPSVSGFVAGWGYTQQNEKLSDELKELEVPYIEPSQCKRKIPEDYEIFFTYDKLCAGILNEGKSVCNGDSGGGLVFKNDNDDRYYLAGIVSLAPRAPTGGCNSQQYAVYTRVSLYVKEFILEKVRLYWA